MRMKGRKTGQMPANGSQPHDDQRSMSVQGQLVPLPSPSHFAITVTMLCSSNNNSQTAEFHIIFILFHVSLSYTFSAHCPVASRVDQEPSAVISKWIAKDKKRNEQRAAERERERHEVRQERGDDEKKVEINFRRRRRQQQQCLFKG